MSLLIFDEQINSEAAIEPLRSWATVRRLKDVRPREAIDDDRVPDLLRQLFRVPEFKTKAARMGKVARISSARIEYLQVNDETIYTLNWPAFPRKR